MCLLTHFVYLVRNNTSFEFCIFFFYLIAKKDTPETVQYGVEGSTTFLECQARSPHMSLKWHLQKENSDRRKEVKAVTLMFPLLVEQVHREHVLSGLYFQVFQFAVVSALLFFPVALRGPLPENRTRSSNPLAAVF